MLCMDTAWVSGFGCFIKFGLWGSASMALRVFASGRCASKLALASTSLVVARSLETRHLAHNPLSDSQMPAPRPRHHPSLAFSDLQAEASPESSGPNLEKVRTT